MSKVNLPHFWMLFVTNNPPRLSHACLSLLRESKVDKTCRTNLPDNTQKKTTRPERETLGKREVFWQFDLILLLVFKRNTFLLYVSHIRRLILSCDNDKRNKVIRYNTFVAWYVFFIPGIFFILCIVNHLWVRRRWETCWRITEIKWLLYIKSTVKLPVRVLSRHCNSVTWQAVTPHKT